MSFLSGLTGMGSFLNNITGATSAARQSQKYALQSGAINNAYQKEFAQNAHQWEVEDLKKAGLNPILSAGGSGASASGGGVNSASVESAGIDPLSAGIGIWQGIEQAQNTAKDANLKDAQAKNTEADTLLKEAQKLTELTKGPLNEEQRKLVNAQLKRVLDLLPKEIENIESDTKLKDVQRKTTGINMNEEDELSIFGMPVYTHKSGKTHRGENIR